MGFFLGLENQLATVRRPGQIPDIQRTVKQTDRNPVFHIHDKELTAFSLAIPLIQMTIAKALGHCVSSLDTRSVCHRQVLSDPRQGLPIRRPVQAAKIAGTFAHAPTVRTIRIHDPDFHILFNTVQIRHGFSIRAPDRTVTLILGCEYDQGFARIQIHAMHGCLLRAFLLIPLPNGVQKMAAIR